MSAHKESVRRIKTSLIVFVVLFFSLLSDCVFAETILKAVSEGDLQQVKADIEKNPSWIHYKSDDGWTLLHWASKYMQVDVAEYLLSKGSDVNARTICNLTPLGLAVSSGVPGDNIFDIDVPRRKK